MNGTCASWSPSKVKYLARYINGYPFKPVDWSDRGRPIIRIQNLSNPDADPNYFEGEIPEVYLVKRGDFLLSWSATLGAYEWLGPDAWLNQHIFKVELDTTLVSKKYYRWLADWFMRELDSEVHGSTMQHLTKDRFGGFKLQLPPPELQETISNYLDRETARINGLIAEKERMLALLEEKRAALISRAVTRGLDPDAPLKPSGLDWLGEIPAHWDVCQLKRTWASSDYGLSESIREEGEIAVLRMNCIVDGRIDVSKAGMITETDDYLLLRRDDLLFNRTNSLDQIAKVGLVDFDPERPLTFASYLVRIRANHRGTPQYLVALLNATLFLEFARKNAIPAIGQANLSPTRYGDIQIPLPPVHEQNQIVDLLAADAAISAPIRKHIRISIDLLKERRAALITAAVTGQIDLKVENVKKGITHGPL